MHVYMTVCHLCMCPFSGKNALVMRRKGAGLERITKTLGTKMNIQIPEGLKRPENPLQAAKLASEGGYIARGHLPVLPHFKEYKKDERMMKNFIGKVSVSHYFVAEYDLFAVDSC